MLCIKKLLTITLTATLLLVSGMAVAHADLSDGLVAYYPFNGNANDESGNANNGTVNGATLTADRFGNVNSAFSFDGVNDYIQFAKVPTTVIDNWTISGWINPSSLPQLSAAVYLGYDNGLTGNGYGFGINNGGVPPGVVSSGNVLYGIYCGVSWLSIGYSSLNINTWYQVVMIRNNGFLKFYINNNLYSINTNKSPIAPSVFYIGSGTGIRYFNGLIDDIRIYNRALSEAEIQELYQEGGGTSNNGNLSISNNPVSGSSGTTFIQSGKGFTPNSTATIHCKKPDGTEYPTISQRIDAIGHFEIKYTAPWDKPAGIYIWWAVDGVTGKASSVASYQITQAQSALQVQTINPQSDESFYKQFFPYPNTANLINGGNQSTIIAADGKSYLLVRLVSDNASEVTISESESDITHNGGLSGIAYYRNTYPLSSVKVKLAQYGNDGKYFGFAVYKAPEDFAISGFENLLTRPVKLNITSSYGNSTVELTLRRPPIFISHGLWSYPDAEQKKFRNELWSRFSDRADKSIDDYIRLNDGSSFNSAEVISGGYYTRSNIREFLNFLRKRGHTVTQVDYLGHSMGGQWGRIVEEKCSMDNFTYNKGYLHKLVTLNTPHIGSFIADIGQFVIDNGSNISVYGFLGGGTVKDHLCWWSDEYKMPVCRGAIEDLTSNGSRKNLLEISVPSHAITGNTPIDTACILLNASTWVTPAGTPAWQVARLLKLTEKMLKVINPDYGCKNWVDIFDFSTQTDYVVGIDSQEGGLSGNYLSGFQHKHTASFNSTVNQTFFDLLNKNIDDISFADGFPASGDIPDTRTRLALKPSPHTRSTANQTPLGEIQFFNPVDGTSVKPGDKVDIELVLTGSLTLEDMLIMAPDSEPIELFTPPYTASFTVPADAYGNFVISVLGSGTDGNLYAASVTLPVSNDAVLQSVEVSPESLSLDLGQTLDISVRGTYSDGSVRALSSATQGTTYKSSDENILSVSQNGTVTPKAAGVGFVLVTHPPYEPVTVRVEILAPYVPSIEPYQVLTDSSPSLDIPSGVTVKVYGSSGVNTINISSGAKVECVNFPGANVINLIDDSPSDFTVRRSGATVYFESAAKGTTVKIPATKTTQTINFADAKSYELVINNGKVM
ncbi:MAG: Ig-like domain-containing protein, partial [Desulfamplus sp.]|nr:Ig-like domain-containing protein [Desulfamplus sp.]